MRAVVVSRFGGPEVLELTERDVPVPGPGELLVEVGAAGVNYLDVYMRSGRDPQRLPFVPGMEGAGTVAATGPGVLGVDVGDRVGWAMSAGGYAELALVPAAAAVPLPAVVPDELAAAALLQGMTAHYLARDSHRVRPGDTVLVHAAAGGTGLVLTQVVRQLGGHVIGTVSTDEKARLALDAAGEVIRYDQVDVVEAVRRLTNGVGVDAVYDGVGAGTFDASLASLRRRGTLVLFGAASGPVPPFDPMRLKDAGSVFLTRPTLAHHIASREELLERSAAVLDWAASGAVRFKVGRHYQLDEVVAAHEDLESRRTVGKLLLLPR